MLEVRLMNYRYTICSAILITILAGCATVEEVQSVQRATLRCEYPWKTHSFIGFYSFQKGMLSPPISDPDPVNLVYYFDKDDCSHGALISENAKGVGLLYSIGQKSWSELMQLKPPPKDAKPVRGITPLDESKEGLAFWAKAHSGEFYLVRIRKVEPETYKDVVAGAVPELEIEWYGPVLRK